MFPEVEIVATAADMEMKLALVEGQWRVGVKHTPDGTTREKNLSHEQAAAVMLLFVAGDEITSPSGTTTKCYEIIGDLFHDWSNEHRPIP